MANIVDEIIIAGIVCFLVLFATDIILRLAVSKQLKAAKEDRKLIRELARDLRISEKLSKVIEYAQPDLIKNNATLGRYLDEALKAHIRLDPNDRTRQLL